MWFVCDHSARSTTIGSAFIARSAGTRQAAPATANNNAPNLQLDGPFGEFHARDPRKAIVRCGIQEDSLWRISLRLIKCPIEYFDLIDFGKLTEVVVSGRCNRRNKDRFGEQDGCWLHQDLSVNCRITFCTHDKIHDTPAVLLVGAIHLALRRLGDVEAFNSAHHRDDLCVACGVTDANAFEVLGIKVSLLLLIVKSRVRISRDV